MASKYDKLDAVTGLEQVAYADLKRALEPRGCVVTHHGTAAVHAPGGKSDIIVEDPKNRRGWQVGLILYRLRVRRCRLAGARCGTPGDEPALRHPRGIVPIRR
jgi:hypothetical protein